MIFKTTLFWLLSGILLMGSMLGIVIASTVPETIIYESTLLNTNQEAITSAHTFRFSLWKSADAVSSDKKNDGSLNILSSTYAGWQEVHNITPQNNGLLSVALGSITSLPDTFDTLQQKYLQIEIKPAEADDTAYQILDVNGDNIADTLDRQAIGSMPFAHQAKYATGTSDTTFTINAKDGVNSGNTFLRFGDLLGRYLAYDIDQSRFILNDDLEVQGNITVNSINNLILDTGTFTNMRTIHIPDTDTTLVGDNTSQEITHKTIDVDKNTIANLGTDDLDIITKKYVFRTPYPGQFITSNNQIDAFLRDEISEKYIETRTSLIAQTLIIHATIKKPINFVEWSGNKITLKMLTTGTDVSKSSIDIRVNDTPVLMDISTGGIWQEITLPIATGTWMSTDTPLNIEMELTASNTAPTGVGDLILHYSGY